MDDAIKGLYQKYKVERIDDIEGKHKNCNYFVLDMVHDKHARAAVIAYAASCHDEYPQLSDDLMMLAEIQPIQQRFMSLVTLFCITINGLLAGQI